MKPLDLSEFEERGRYRACKVRTILAQLDDEHREKLTAALSGSFAHTKIAEVVTGWGYPLSDSAVGAHRRKVCSCD